MKKIGIVGGVAWLSTVDYYAEICRRSERFHHANQLSGAPSIPEMSIESLDLRKAISYLGREGDEASWSQFDDYHRTALQRLQASGAEFALIASNTPHDRLASIARGIGIPVIDIFEVVAKESARIGASEVLILGTAQTTRSARFREQFARHGIQADGPADDETRATIARLLEELQAGVFEGAAERVERIVKTLFQRQFSKQPVVCLACTELPLAFPNHKMLPAFEYSEVLYINSSAVHIAAAFDFAASEPPRYI